jgi:TetR/AcrR family transcriptional repressor of nem operon
VTNVKDELKRLATEQAQRGGVRSVTLRDLGRAVGIKSPSVLHHFKNKDTLVFEITQDYVRRVRQTLSEIERRHTSARTRVLAAVDMFLDVQARHELCLCTMLAAEAHAVDVRTRNVLRDFFTDLEAWIARVLRADEGNTLTPGQASARSQLIVTALEGAMLLDKAEGEPRRLAALRSTLGRLVG